MISLMSCIQIRMKVVGVLVWRFCEPRDGNVDNAKNFDSGVTGRLETRENCHNWAGTIRENFEVATLYSIFPEELRSIDVMQEAFLTSLADRYPSRSGIITFLGHSHDVTFLLRNKA